MTWKSKPDLSGYYWMLDLKKPLKYAEIVEYSDGMLWEFGAYEQVSVPADEHIIFSGPVELPDLPDLSDT